MIDINVLSDSLSTLLEQKKYASLRDILATMNPFDRGVDEVDAAIDRLVHHAIILELTGSSFRTEQAQGRQQPAALTERDPAMERDTPSNHRAPETVTELGGHSANVKE